MISGVRPVPLLAAVILMSLGVMFNIGGAFTLSQILVECERVPSGGICRIPEDPLSDNEARVVPVSLLMSAEVTYQNKRYGLKLVTPLKQYRLLEGYLWRESLDSLSGTINEFIQKPAMTALRVRNTAFWYAIPVGVLLLGAGGYCLTLALRPPARAPARADAASPMRMAAG